MVAKHPCPNCGTDRSAASERCPKCHFPDHVRAESIPEQAAETTERRPFQFRIFSVLMIMVVIAIAAQFVAAYGWDGLAAVLRFSAISPPVFEFLWQLWRNLTSGKVEKAEW